jgi:thioredoxin 1
MATFKELIKGNTPVLVDFYAEWCGPCKTMSPILTEVAKQVKGKAKILKINVDKNRQAANVYKVQGVPTFILFKNGKQIWRQSGVIQTNELVNLIHQNI